MQFFIFVRENLMPPYTIFYVQNASNPFIYAGTFGEVLAFFTVKYQIPSQILIFY